MRRTISFVTLFQQFERELIEYLENFEKVSIEKVAEHFFPAPLPYRYYFVSKIRKRMGFDPLSWDKFDKINDKSELETKFAETAQIAEKAIDSVKTSLESLIQQRKIYGWIESKLDGTGPYFIKGKNEIQIQKDLHEDLLDIKRFLNEDRASLIILS